MPTPRSNVISFPAEEKPSPVSPGEVLALPGERWGRRWLARYEVPLLIAGTTLGGVAVIAAFIFGFVAVCERIAGLR